MEEQPDLASEMSKDQSGEPSDNASEMDRSKNPGQESSPLQRMHRLTKQPAADESHNLDFLEGIPTEIIDLLKPDGSLAANNSEEVAAAPDQDNPEPEDTTIELPEKTNLIEPDVSNTEIKRDSFNSAESLAQSMRDRGYLLEEDASGVRLGGAPVRRGNQDSMLSATELVQLAAEMEGGILPPEKRIHCPHCDAVVKPEDKNCPWCSKNLSAPSAPKK